MLSKEFRLTKKKEIEEIYRKGKFKRKDALAIKYLKKNQKEGIKIAIVVSLKAEKKAVKRNKLKRHLREIIKKNLPKMQPGYVLVIITYPGASEKSFAELKKITGELFKGSGLIK